MKYLFLSLALCLGLNLVQAQNFDFNSYKYRFQRYRGLTSTLNLAGNNNVLRSVMTDNYGVSDRLYSKSYTPTVNFNTVLSNNYFHFISTDRWQKSLSVNLNLRTTVYAFNGKSDAIYPGVLINNERINRTYQNEVFLSMNSENRLYFPGKRFLLLAFNGTYDLGGQRNKYQTFNNNVSGLSGNDNSSFVQSNTNVRIGGGKGRLEYVTDAVMSYFLLRDLSKKAQIGEVSAAQIEQVAKGMSRIRNTRFTDFRFQLIDQIEYLDTVLKNAGISSGAQARYFTSLYDNWLYATNLARFSGHRLTYYLNTNLVYNQSKSEVNSSTTPHLKAMSSSQNLGLGAGIDFENSKQLSYKVQRSWGLGLLVNHANSPFNQQIEDSIGTGQYSNKERSYTRKFYNVSLSASYGYLYQPNSRTYLQLSFVPEFVYGRVYSEINSELTDRPTTSYNQSTLTMNMNYFRFINARVSFWINVSQVCQNYNSNRIYNYINEGDGLRKNNDIWFYTNYTMGLRYAIF